MAPLNPPLTTRPAGTTARDLVIISALAAAIRATFFFVSLMDPPARQIEEDSRGYLSLASNLLEGRGFGREVLMAEGEPLRWLPELCRTPAYPVLLAALERVFGDPRTAVIVLQHLLGLVLVAWAYLLCRRYFGRRAACIAGGLLALDLQSAALSNLVLTETLYSMMLFAAAVALAALVTRPRLAPALLTGLLIGVSALLRPSSLYLPAAVLLVFTLYALRRRDPRYLGTAFGVSAGAVLCIAGWSVRNGVVAGEYTFSTIPRYNLVACHAAGAVARAKSLSQFPAECEVLASLGLTRAQLRYLPMSGDENRRVRSAAVDIIQSNMRPYLKEWALRTANVLAGPEKHVLTVLGLGWVNFGVHESGGKAVGENSPLALALVWGQLPLVALTGVLALVGLARSRRAGPAGPLIAAMFGVAAYVLILSSGPPGDPRLRCPALPLIVVVAASALRTNEEPIAARA